MASIVTDFLTIDIKSKPYYVHAKQPYLEFRLLSAARAGPDVYENDYNKINCYFFIAKIICNII